MEKDRLLKSPHQKTSSDSCLDKLLLASELLPNVTHTPKLEWWGTGMVICLERDADLHVAQLMLLPLTVSCFTKIQIGFTFLVPAHPGSPGKRAVKQVCVLRILQSWLTSNINVNNKGRQAFQYIYQADKSGRTSRSDKSYSVQQINHIHYGK